MVITGRTAIVSPTTQGRLCTGPKPTIATCGGELMGSRLATGGNGDRRVGQFGGAKTAPPDPADEVTHLRHQHGQRQRRGVVNRRRRQPAASNSDGHADMNSCTWLVTFSGMES